MGRSLSQTAARGSLLPVAAGRGQEVGKTTIRVWAEKSPCLSGQCLISSDVPKHLISTWLQQEEPGDLFSLCTVQPTLPCPWFTCPKGTCSFSCLLLYCPSGIRCCGWRVAGHVLSRYIYVYLCSKGWAESECLPFMPKHVQMYTWRDHPLQQSWTENPTWRNSSNHHLSKPLQQLFADSQHQHLQKPDFPSQPLARWEQSDFSDPRNFPCSQQAARAGPQQEHTPHLPALKHFQRIIKPHQPGFVPLQYLRNPPTFIFALAFFRKARFSLQ